MTLHVDIAPDGPFELRMVRLYNCVIPKTRIVVPRVAFTVFVNEVRAGTLDEFLASEDEMAAAMELVRWCTSGADDDTGH
ncbi:hypothetical protein [Streptomyces yaizuensis]|uniref:Uncharacterized protein n=1 Tax=Streptomyces yaizuensis TaxID=2989713 RepID=A0ABQ5P3X1_9ACTN|nr:hypothetical protein [Streptomyces sp. YSPA8]GLF97254.1 hypothetical protein SYYSPA8_23175 [Streptomyces sp. YSPA8]